MSVVSHVCRNFAAARQSLASSFNQRLTTFKRRSSPSVENLKTRLLGTTVPMETLGKSHTHCRFSGSLQWSRTQTHKKQQKKNVTCVHAAPVVSSNSPEEPSAQFDSKHAVNVTVWRLIGQSRFSFWVFYSLSTWPPWAPGAL